MALYLLAVFWSSSMVAAMLRAEVRAASKCVCGISAHLPDQISQVTLHKKALRF